MEAAAVVAVIVVATAFAVAAVEHLLRTVEMYRVSW